MWREEDDARLLHVGRGGPRIFLFGARVYARHYMGAVVAGGVGREKRRRCTDMDVLAEEGHAYQDPGPGQYRHRRPPLSPAAAVAGDGGVAPSEGREEEERCGELAPEAVPVTQVTVPPDAVTPLAKRRPAVLEGARCCVRHVVMCRVGVVSCVWK